MHILAADLWDGKTRKVLLLAMVSIPPTIYIILHTCVIDLMRICLRLRNPNIDSDGFGNI